MHVPIACSGVHAVPNTLHSHGLMTPLSTSPHWHAFGSATRTPGVRVADPKACQCGEVLKGVIKPWECKVFGTACTPEHAIGTCMVSPEGACAAYYNYGRFAREREVV